MITLYRIVLAGLGSMPCMAAATPDVLSPLGYGQIHFGMKLRAAELALKQGATPKYDGSGCDYVQFKKYPRLRFMVEDGILTRADAKKRTKNSANVLVGMSLDHVKSMHPEVKIQPHKCDDEGHYAILSTADNRAAIVLEASKGKVTAIRAGLEPSVEYVEGCQ